jgi:ABC-type transport system involved in cytochrome bd biosynthesis fused ATPase/permease subunit
MHAHCPPNSGGVYLLPQRCYQTFPPLKELALRAMDQQRTAEVQAFGLVKRYGGQLAVNDLSFSLKPGQITGFLGPNGAGKTTTMQLMLGLIHGEGCTLFGGQRYGDLEVPGRVVGALLDSQPFHPTRTARQHLPAHSSRHPDVLVRSPDASSLAELLSAQGLAVKQAGDGRLQVAGTDNRPGRCGGIPEPRPCR